jgi:hypothetical protein
MKCKQEQTDRQKEMMKGERPVAFGSNNTMKTA